MTREEKERKLVNYLIEDNFYAGCPYCGEFAELNDINPVGDVVTRTCIPCGETFEFTIMVRISGIQNGDILIQA